MFGGSISTCLFSQSCFLKEVWWNATQWWEKTMISWILQHRCMPCQLLQQPTVVRLSSSDQWSALSVQPRSHIYLRMKIFTVRRRNIEQLRNIGRAKGACRDTDSFRWQRTWCRHNLISNESRKVTQWSDQLRSWDDFPMVANGLPCRRVLGSIRWEDVVGTWGAGSAMSSARETSGQMLPNSWGISWA